MLTHRGSWFRDHAVLRTRGLAVKYDSLMTHKVHVFSKYEQYSNCFMIAHASHFVLHLRFTKVSRAQACPIETNSYYNITLL